MKEKRNAIAFAMWRKALIFNIFITFCNEYLARRREGYVTCYLISNFSSNWQRWMTFFISFSTSSFVSVWVYVGRSLASSGSRLSCTERVNELTIWPTEPWLILPSSKVLFVSVGGWEFEYLDDGGGGSVIPSFSSCLA